jgi:hypothetical protein
MQLPDVYERWRRQQDRWAREVVDADMIDLTAHRISPERDPAELVVAGAALDDVLPGDRFRDVRFMFVLSQSGYTMADIAWYFTDAGTPHTEAMVRSSMNRARKWARKQRHDHEGDNP